MNEGSVMLDEHVPAFQDSSAHVEDPALRFELRNVLTAALESLSEDYRAIVLLRDVEGLSPQHVSQITGLSIGGVKTRTHRARLMLRKRLGEYLSDRPSSPSPRGEGRVGRRRPPPRSGRRISSRRAILSVRCDRSPAASSLKRAAVTDAVQSSS